MSIAQSARSYFDLACRLMKPRPPLLVAIGGLSGTGKSALARSLAPDLTPIPGAVVVRSDVERKALFGRAETERLPPEAYSADVSARIYATLQQKAERIIAAGHSAIVDAVFARPAERKSVADIAQSHGVRFQGIFLTASLETRLARVGTRALDASDADARIVLAQESYELGSMEWNLIDASGTPEETLRRSRTALAERA
jgi:predicted kinase